MTIEFVRKICKFDECPTVCNEIGPVVIHRSELTENDICPSSDNKLIRRLSIVTKYEIFKFKRSIR